MAKRPWLLTTLGQRLSLFLVFAISTAAIAPAVIQIQIQEQQYLIPQLDPSAVSYCELSVCGEIATLGGLRISPDIDVNEMAYGTEVLIPVINTSLLIGEREVWAQVRTEEGKLVEGMRTILTLTDQGPQVIRLNFTGSKAEFQQLRLFLGF